jgi:hypothetical protein
MKLAHKLLQMHEAAAPFETDHEKVMKLKTKTEKTKGKGATSLQSAYTEFAELFRALKNDMTFKQKRKYELAMSNLQKVFKSAKVKIPKEGTFQPS